MLIDKKSGVCGETINEAKSVQIELSYFADKDL